MEVIRDGGIWRHIEIDDETQVGAARRQAALACAEAGVPDELTAKALLVAVELATNLHKHARRGILYVKAASAQTVDLMSVDHGPGMDLQQCFVDGYSTSQTQGTGLGAVRRLASVFDAYTDTSGSVFFARVGRSTPGLEYGSLAIPIRGESVSGDQWALRGNEDGWSLVMADGLGHGPQAHAASAFCGPIADIDTTPSLQLQRANDLTRGTRGCAAAALRHRASGPVLEYASVGNLHCVVVRREQAQALAGQNGTVGGAFPQVKQQQAAVEPRGLVVVHTDGLSGRWSLDRYPGLRLRHPQVVCGVLFRDCNRQRDDATVVAIRS